MKTFSVVKSVGLTNFMNPNRGQLRTIFLAKWEDDKTLLHSSFLIQHWLSMLCQERGVTLLNSEHY